MNKVRQQIIDRYPDYEDELLFADGFDSAIMGVVEQFGTSIRVCYDRDKVIKQLVKNGMTDEEAFEYYEFNIIGAYVGEYTPVFLDKL